MTPFPLLQRFELTGWQNAMRPIAERVAALIPVRWHSQMAVRRLH